MRSFRFYILCFLFLIRSSAFAADLQVYVWKPENSRAKILLPIFSDAAKPDHLNFPVPFLMAYLNALSQSPDYTNAVDFKNPPVFGAHFEASLFEAGTKPAIAIQTNRTGQLFGRDSKREIALESHGEAGADPYLIPVGLDLLYTDEQLETWNLWIARNFKALVLLGGADLDPALYHAVNTHSVCTSLRRDLVEMKTVSRYLSASRGIVIGYCRGAQLLAVLKSGSLIQDIPAHLPGSSIAHRITAGSDSERARASAWHQIHFVNPSCLFTTTPQENIQVNSRHHQGKLTLSQSTGLIVTARADDGIIEAFESTDGRIFGFQFHPEDMRTAFSRMILKNLIQKAQTHPCLQLLESNP